MTTELRLAVIRLLHRAPQPLSTLEIARTLSSSRNTMWRLLARLEESGLLSRTCQVTATGRETVWTIRTGKDGRWTPVA